MSRSTARRSGRALGVLCGIGALALLSSAGVALSSAPAKAAPHASRRVRIETATVTGAPRANPAPLNIPSKPVTLEREDGSPSIVVHPPAKHDAPQPLTVMLHGMCDEPDMECPWFDSAATPGGWLVCPRANVRCDGGGSTWSADPSKTVEASIARMKLDYGAAVDDADNRTLVGFSLGASRALDLAQNGGGKYRYLVLIAAKVYPDAEKLRRAGVERIVLAAGDYDMTHAHMLAQARRLAKKGYPVAFMSMGKVGHTFPRDLPERMTRALGWLHGATVAQRPSNESILRL